jgi:hypothetical protein
VILVAALCLVAVLSAAAAITAALMLDAPDPAPWACVACGEAYTSQTAYLAHHAVCAGQGCEL